MFRRALRLAAAVSAGLPASVAALEAGRARRVDELFREGRYDDVRLNLQLSAHPDDPEVLWRLARAHRFLALDASSTSEHDRRRHAERALEMATQAIALDDQCAAAHKWYGICLSTLGDFIGTKESLRNAYLIKQSWDRAHVLDPNDPTTLNLLGSWSFYFADMGTATYYTAKLLFDPPPTSTYQQSLDYFLQAESISPGRFAGLFLGVSRRLTILSQKGFTRPTNGPLQSATSVWATETRFASGAMSFSPCRRLTLTIRKRKWKQSPTRITESFFRCHNNIAVVTHAFPLISFC